MAADDKNMAPQAPSSTVETGRRDLREWERLILDVSTALVRLDSGELDSAIQIALSELGEYAGADRSYLFLYDESRDTMTNTHEWCAPRIEPQRQHLQDIPAGVWPYWMRHLRDREIVNWPSVRDLPDEASAERDALGEQSVQSVVAVPIVESDRLLGFVGFDAVTSESYWSENEVYLLRLSANVLASAMLRMRGEQALREARDRLLHTTKLEALGRFVSSTAHDFNNLLTVMLGNCEIDREKSTREQLIGQIDEIRGAAERAAALTRNLLTFGRRQLPSYRPVNVNDLVRHTEGFLARILGETIAVECELDPDAGSVLADELQLQHVLLNLAANARDAMPGGGKLRLRSLRVLRPDGTHAVAIEVRDSGLGMDATTAASAFEPFFTTKPAEAGTGLGLASVHEIVTKSGGTVSLDSAPGRGTVVRLEFPNAQPPDTIEREAESHGPASAAPLTGTALLVEDDAAVLQVVSSMLETTGLRTIAVTRGRAALDVLARGEDRIDIMLTDRVMPGMSGSDLVGLVREKDRDLPIVAISGYGRDRGAGRIGQDARVRHLQKPFTYEQLLHVLRDLLGPHE